jgi:hypothetical protein
METREDRDELLYCCRAPSPVAGSVEGGQTHGGRGSGSPGGGEAVSNRRLQRWGLLAVVGLLGLGLAGFIGFRLAVGMLKDKILEALGPGSEVRELRVGWSAVEVVGLRLKGPAGWPAADQLRAERVVVTPSVRSLFGGELRVTSIRVERPYLSAQRTQDGRLRVVPGLLERSTPKGQAGASAPMPSVYIGRITLADGMVELFDATVARPPLRIRLEQLQATLKDILLPALTGQTAFDLTGVVKGVKQDGRAAVSGWTEVATKDSSVKLELRGVDLVAFQPYLSRAADVRVQKGTMDLALASDVRKNQLKAPGTMTITDLELAPSQGAMGTFMGMSRGAVLGAMQDKRNRISVKFILEGDIANPAFSLNEAFSMRMAASMADTLGVSFRGVAEGAGSLGRKGTEALGETMKGFGDSVQKLFGGQKK